MILSASRRTDIPAFFSEWFFNRIDEGYFLVRNPDFPRKVSKVIVSPQVIDCIVFWTKNPVPIIPKLDRLKDYDYYFQFTLTGYGRDIEAKLPDKKKVLIPAFIGLSEKLGPERVIWRYDPILFNDKYSAEYHLRAFSEIASSLKGFTKKCVISFVDNYGKVKKALESLNEYKLNYEQLLDFSSKLFSIASENGMEIATCAEKIDLSSVGIRHNSCIDRELVEKITGGKLKVKKHKAQRDGCQCVESIEMGAYNTCSNGCKYCYANQSPSSIIEMLKKYDPASPMLCGKLEPEDTLYETKMKSLLDLNITF